MIEITEAKHGFLCQVCYNNEGVKEINFHAEGTGVIVRLCKSCRQKLETILKDDNKQKAHSVPISDGVCFVAEMGDIMHDVLKCGEVEQAKKMHWGTYCRSWEMCNADGMCCVVCPGGGVGAKEER